MSEKEVPKLPRIYLSKAYLKEVELNLFGLFRDCMVEDPETGHSEKTGRTIGPIALLRPVEKGEQATLRTVHPATGKELSLIDVRLSGGER